MPLYTGYGDVSVQYIQQAQGVFGGVYGGIAVYRDESQYFGLGAARATAMARASSMPGSVSIMSFSDLLSDIYYIAC